jgi:endonuclease/exonuclease/phosphatase family metal-dependent hydrolase
VETDRVYGSGLALLSHGEQVDYTEVHYDECHGVLEGASDCLASKGFQVLTTTLGGVEIDLYNTHHEAGGGSEDEAVRLGQVDQVLAFMAGRSDRAVIYTGDFNLHPDDVEDDEPLARYADAGLRNACDEVACAEPNHIDMIRLRDSGQLELTVEGWSRETQFVDEDGVDLSDHQAISATIRWRVVQ